MPVLCQLFRLRLLLLLLLPDNVHPLAKWRGIGIHSSTPPSTTTSRSWRPSLVPLQTKSQNYDRLKIRRLHLQLHAEQGQAGQHQMELGIQQQQHYASNRRSFLSQFCVSVISLRGLSPTLASATTVDLPSDKIEDVADDEGEPAFHSAAYGLEEYNNSIVASRDTNISPKEVYDTISSEYLRGAHAAAIAKNADTSSNSSSGRRKRRMTPKALDVGAGAGVSTEILYNMGYQTIDALDWSGKAWERYVIDDPAGVCPTSVQFYELDDERYLESWRRKYGGEKEGHSEQEEGADGLFDAIVFNFAINESKAVTFATELLNKDHGILLAPINTSTDYWLKQRYKVMDASGKVLWSAEDVGAWSVLFQPDVTQDTCQGIWCSPYNGFQKKK